MKRIERLALLLLFAIGFCGCATAPKKTTGLEVLSMCGGFYTGKALESPQKAVAIDQVDRFLDECRAAATDGVCSHYACLITQSTEARIQRDLDAKPGTTTPGTIFERRPRKLSEDPVNPSLTSLGRLHPNDWPRLLPRPAWMQWWIQKKAT